MDVGGSTELIVFAVETSLLYDGVMSNQTQYPVGILRVRPQDYSQWQVFLFAKARFSPEGVIDCSAEEPWFFPGTSPGEQGVVRRLKKDELNPSQKYGVSADRRTRIIGLRADSTLFNKAVGFAVLDTSTPPPCPTCGQM